MKLLHHALCTLLLSTSASFAIASTDTDNIPKQAWSLDGFNEPESILPHPTKDVLYVSNMNGSPVELNGKGYISLVSASGKVIEKEWITGLNAPKGMALHDEYLYVGDMQQLHIINHTQGELVKSIQQPSATMLNDVAVDDKGHVYISDLLGGGIYRYNPKTEKLDQWISPKQLPHPNGLFFDAESESLLLATWGEGLQKDFSTTTLGGLYNINLKNKTITPYTNAQEFGNLDGIARIGDTWFINDWINGNVFSYKNNTLNKVFNAGKNAADISAKGRFLYVPIMFEKRIDVYEIK